MIVLVEETISKTVNMLLICTRCTQVMADRVQAKIKNEIEAA